MDAANISKIIDTVCEKLELPMQKGFEYLCVIGMRDTIIAFVIFAITIAVWIIFIVATVKKHTSQYYEEQDYWDSVQCIAFFPSIILGVLSLFTIGDAILYLLSPQSWAMNYIISRL